MGPDFGSFVGQILPGVFFIYVVIPLTLILLWFLLVRPYLRKRGWMKTPQPKSEVTAPVPQTSSRVDTGMLPDLDMILQASDTPLPIMDGIQTVTLNTGEERQATSVLTVIRDEADGRLMVQIDGIGYRSLKDTGEPKQMFTRVMKELSGYILQGDGETNPEAEAPTPTPQQEVAPPAPVDPPPPLPKRTTTELPTLPDGSLPGDLPSYKFDDNPARIEKKSGGRVKVDFIPPPDLDIPGAIEAYLQYKIKYAPAFQGRNIHVLPAVGGGVRIRVGEEYFDAVSDITSDEVRIFLQETIAEWQERQ